MRKVTIDADGVYGGEYVEFETGEWRHVEASDGWRKPHG